MISVISKLLKDAMQIQTEEAETIVNFNQTHKPRFEQARDKAGRQGTFIHPGQVTHLRCHLPTDFNTPVALFEVSDPDIKLQAFDIADGLFKGHKGKRPYIEIPIGNHSESDNISAGSPSWIRGRPIIKSMWLRDHNT